MPHTSATSSPVPHTADSHDLIHVHGARQPNLKDVSIALPKRRPTVFTGASGSGKSSPAFATTAAESQRLINETCPSSFVQNLMPAQARPEADVLEGLTAAIIVDQQRMGSDPRPTVGTATDANAMLRILFSRPGDPHIGPPSAVLVQHRVDQRKRLDHRGGRRQQEGNGRLQPHRRHVHAVRGPGTVPDIGLTQLYDDSKAIAEGAFTLPGWKSDSGGRCVRTPNPASSTRTSRSASSPSRRCRTSCTRGRPR